MRPAHSGHGVPPRSILATVARRTLLPVWLAAFTFFVAVLALFSFMKTFVITTGMGSVGSFFSAYAATAVSLRIFLGWLPDRLGARRMLGFAMGCYASGLRALSLAQTAGHVLTAGLLCGAGHGYTFPLLFSLVVARARPQERGAATAFFAVKVWNPRPKGIVRTPPAPINCRPQSRGFPPPRLARPLPRPGCASVAEGGL